MVVRTRDSEIRACRVESFRSFHRSRCVTRLLSDPRHVTASLEAQGTMPHDAQERLRKSLQSSLRRTLLRLVSVLDVEEIDTAKLLSVPLCCLQSLVPGLRLEELACAEQWAALARCVAAREVSAHRHDLVVSGVLQYEPNLHLKALATVVHRPAERVVLRCTECSQPMSSSWYFFHPRTGAAQVLTPSRGHYRCSKLHSRTCYFRSKERSESILDIFTNLDFCEHKKQRKFCVLCGGCACCAHGKQRHRCSMCAPLLKRGFAS